MQRYNGGILDAENIAVAPKATDAASILTVESIDTHIYFYSEVNSDRCLALMRTLRQTDDRLRNEKLSRGIPDVTIPIWLHINSGGGSVFSALAVADQIGQFKTPIYSIVEGCVASAATLISVACAKRLIQPNAFMLIHQFYSVFWGKYTEFKDEAVIQEMLWDKMVGHYEKHSALTAKRVSKLLKHDTWLDAAKAVKYGLVDSVTN